MTSIELRGSVLCWVVFFYAVVTSCGPYNSQGSREDDTASKETRKKKKKKRREGWNLSGFAGAKSLDLGSV